ncbi:MAG: bifunctional (p)ppGpp synthetase/guanosine-3',5'-bis(diphosphate) 3'-pyrophosphohydrolase [Tenericutes bacterium]|nr:bifunctional (p)ppGpp synthetase/guanosine-3',5'-bis(diphosphate) 3'-pyrophosphohydrolase [Mycoplasmatota bacterium]
MTKEDIYLPLLEEVTKYLKTKEHLDFIKSAFDYACEMHAPQKRKSGEPYIVHPRDVAITLAKYQVDPNTLVSGLLHDVIEDTPATYEDIKEKFNEEIADIVEGVTKLDMLHYKGSKASQQVKNHQKMVLAMAKDIRVIFVKLADRLNNMRTLGFLDDARQTRISRETLDIFAPIAHRLGMYRLKAELEDLSFKYIYPVEYQEIANLLTDKKENRETDVENMKNDLFILLNSENFVFDITGRIKNIHSVYYKMKHKDVDFEEINDLLALRIVVQTISDCYRAIGIVHSKLIPVPGRFKDYIAMPKPNMYQSLHTTVVNRGKIFEIQIRTEEMDAIAEKGVAAHWAYKETAPSKASSRKSLENIVSSKLRWYSELIQYTEENDSDEEILNIFTDDILNANVYVFTPNGDIIDLAAGATPLDFAFRIHTKVGEKTVGAIVNGKIRPLDYTLKTGDLVEIKTSKNSVGPNENWLKIAKTSNARSKIKNFLNKQRREFLIERGKEELDREITLKRVDIKVTDTLVEESFKTRGIKTLEDLYFEIRKNVVSPIGAANLLTGKEELTDEDLLEKINKAELVKKRYVHSDINIVVEGLDKPSVRLANCCNPVLGDEIIGYVSRSSGIVVHRQNCNNVESFEKPRLLDVFWGTNTLAKYVSNIKILVVNRDNVLAEIVHSATASKAKILQVSAQQNNIKEGIIKMRIQIGSLVELNYVITNIQKLKGIYSIERIG